MLFAALREQVVEVEFRAPERGLAHGAAGNISVRDPDPALITISPNALPDRNPHRRRR